MRLIESLPPGGYLRTIAPNPITGATTLQFMLPVAGSARLTFRTPVGTEAVRLVEEWLDAGEHQVAFDGSRLPAGLYCASLELDGVLLQTRAVLVVK